MVIMLSPGKVTPFLTRPNLRFRKVKQASRGGAGDSNKVRGVCEEKPRIKFEFIRKESKNYNVKLLCKLLGVSRSGYYEFTKRLPSKSSLKHEWLTDEIKRVFYQYKGRYGSPRIAQQLYDEGMETNKRVVAMLMQKAGFVAVREGLREGLKRE